MVWQCYNEFGASIRGKRPAFPHQPLKDENMQRSQQKKGVLAKMAPGVAGVLLLSQWLCPAPACAQTETAAVEFKTSAAMTSTLDSTTGVHWAENPLRRAVTRLSHVQGVSIWLDRRLDPGRKMAFSANNVSMKTLLQRLAARLNAGVCRVGDVMYIGPPTLTQKLATVAAVREQEVRSFPPAVQKRLLQTRTRQWKILATPQEIIAAIAEDYGLKVVGLQKLPHDLWPAIQLPPLTCGDQLSLVLAGFDLTFEFSPAGDAIRFRTLPATVALTKSYRVVGRASQWVRDLQTKFPGSQLRTAGEMLEVSGPQADHAAIAALVQGKPVRTRPNPQAGKKVFTLAVKKQKAGAVAKTVASRNNLKFTYDQTALPGLNRLVSFDVKDVDLDTLLRAALDPAGLTYQIKDGALHISPAQ